MNPVIEAEHISKLYRKGRLGSDTFKQDLKLWWNRYILKKDNPYFNASESSGDYFWALNDISFQVAEGEILGIIGKNGSGKSTLLKIISKITSPTRGTVRGRGKISSMLEVGTGFSPDLTGRQNIFLSGAILGMTRQDVQSRFDEIVNFSGVEEFIDTPVKRYSSGMYVRLAFSVAAHLNAEIMIIDEVLAVGDAAFQQKCLQKMNEITRTGGRTILFVTHNMPSVREFCSRAIWLDAGNLRAYGTPDDIVKEYMLSLGYLAHAHTWEDPAMAPGNDAARLKAVRMLPKREKHVYDSDEPITIAGEIWCFHNEGKGMRMRTSLITQDGVHVLDAWSEPVPARSIMAFQVSFPTKFFAPISYTVSLSLHCDGEHQPISEFPYVAGFSINSPAGALPNKGIVGSEISCTLTPLLTHAG